MIDERGDGGVIGPIQTPNLMWEAMKSLSRLKRGWDGHDGQPITPAALDTAGHLCVTPLSSGGLQIELHAGGADIEIEIGADGSIKGVGVTP